MEQPFYDGYKPKSLWINRWHLDTDHFSRKRPLETTLIKTKKKKLTHNTVQIITQTIKHEITIETALDQSNNKVNYVKQMYLREPLVFNIGDEQLHIIFDENNNMMILRTELYQILQIYSSIFTYWTNKLNIVGITANNNFLLMCECRKIIPGRSTYTLYTLDDVSRLLLSAFKSRKIKNFNVYNLKEFLDILIGLYNALIELHE
jgi:hypothetical protein